MQPAYEVLKLSHPVSQLGLSRNLGRNEGFFQSIRFFEGALMDEESESKLTLPWAVAAIILTFPLLLVFMHFGESGTGRAAWFCAAAIFCGVRFRWELSSKRWFWPSIAAISLIHLPLILLIPWNAAWVPWFLIFPLVLVDFFLVLILIHRVEKYMARRGPSRERVRI
ncbi:MAG TPA: hypothetical protein VME68_18800 [Acidobacteriaceae bacterium]|nr:hypothetical protein [Acidobacteriaceae bacterium]